MGDHGPEAALREEIRTAVSRLLGERELLMPGPEDEERIRALIHEQVAAHQRRAAATNAALLTDPEGTERRLFDGLLRLGILQPFMEAPAVEEIICNGPSRIFVIEDGQKRLVPDLYFDDDEELLQLIKRLVGPLGRRLDESSPMVDARLPDGSRLNAAIPPATTRWCSLTIRKFILRAHSLDQLVALGTLPRSAAQFLDAAVQAGVNILVSGQRSCRCKRLPHSRGLPTIRTRRVAVEWTVDSDGAIAPKKGEERRPPHLHKPLMRQEEADASNVVTDSKKRTGRGGPLVG